MKLPSRRWLIAAFFVAAFAALMLSSILYETLLPLWQAGDSLRFWVNVFGIPMQIAGTLLLPVAFGLGLINLISPKFEIWVLTSRRRFALFFVISLIVALLGSYLVNVLG